MDFIRTDDFAYLYGFSLFETMLVNQYGEVFLLENHIKRMFDSMDFFQIKYTMTVEETRDLVMKYILDNCVRNKILRITSNAGNSSKSIEQSFSFYLRENNYTKEKILDGTSICLSTIRKSESSVLLYHKTSNYLENFYSLHNAMDKNYDDCIFLNNKSYITETSKANIFFVKDGVLCTPSLECGLLPGIIRKWVLNRAKELKIKCEEGFFKVEDLINADEAFLTNSAFGLMHIKNFEKNNLGNSQIGNITKTLKEGILSYL